jgi:5-methylcytosine-specific restriction endonuclease McrA
MEFGQLKSFIDKSMRMSHLYQPVMLLALLEKGGKASVRDIATSILVHDESQIDYYESITKEMVGRVLRSRRVVEKEGKAFRLLDYDRLTPKQVQQLRDACRRKLAEFKERRGAAIWQHRKTAEGNVSGTLRYEVLKRARFRCELCGISAEVKALEVDHIVPRSKGGSDDLSNLQALCYSCNAMKRDRDDTDFRKVVESYRLREAGCVFCEVGAERVLLESQLAFAVADRFPVTVGHALVIPKRHVAGYFDLGRPELNAVYGLLERLKRQAEEADSTVKGFNIGINAGAAAGQTVFPLPRSPDPPAGGRRAKPGGRDSSLDARHGPFR